jgi:hypothetical protein
MSGSVRGAEEQSSAPTRHGVEHDGRLGGRGLEEWVFGPAYRALLIPFRRNRAILASAVAMRTSTLTCIRSKAGAFEP